MEKQYQLEASSFSKKFKHSHEENMVDSGLVDSEFLSTKQSSFDDSIVSVDMISIFDKKCVECSNVSSRTSTPIFNKSSSLVAKKLSRTHKQGFKSSMKKGPTPDCNVTRKSKISKLSISRSNLKYFDLSRNHNYNYEINMQCFSDADLFYNCNANSNGFQHFGGLRVWYVWENRNCRSFLKL